MTMVTCMRMISHQRLPKPRFEIRAEQNADGGAAVSKSDDDDDGDDDTRKAFYVLVMENLG